MEESFVAANGIKVYTYRNAALNSFFISAFLKAGSMYESEEENGITHFLEHVLVRNVNAVFDGRLYSDLDAFGLEFNASTYAEMVQFYTSGATDNFKRGASIITSILSPIVLSASEIDTERRRIKAEIRESDDRNSMSAFAAETVNCGTTLKNFITGTNKSVSRITKRRLLEYRRSVFTRENVFFYVTGSFTDDDIAFLIEKIGKAEIFEGEEHTNVAPVPKSFGSRDAAVAVKNGDYTAVRFNFDIDMSVISNQLVDIIYDSLFVGYSSPFFIKMSEEKGLFYDISGSTERYKNIGTLYFSYEVKEKDLYDAISLSVDILNSFMNTDPDHTLCINAGYTANSDILLDDARELNFTMAYDSHILGLGYRSNSERKRAYLEVTPSRVNEGARLIFTPDNLTLTIKGNKKKTDIQKIRTYLNRLGQKSAETGNERNQT